MATTKKKRSAFYYGQRASNSTLARISKVQAEQWIVKPAYGAKEVAGLNRSDQYLKVVSVDPKYKSPKGRAESGWGDILWSWERGAWKKR